MTAASKLTLIACSIFFLIGLLTGVWKFLAIRRSLDAQAPRYVSVSHRTSLMYAFAALLLMKFVEMSSLPEHVKLVAAAVPLFFFATAIGVYILHGVLQDTDNQYRKPYRVGKTLTSPFVFDLLNWFLIFGELGDFLFCSLEPSSLYLWVQSRLKIRAIGSQRR